jgi:hypothetical protein
MVYDLSHYPFGIIRKNFQLLSRLGKHYRVQRQCPDSFEFVKNVQT